MGRLICMALKPAMPMPATKRTRAAKRGWPEKPKAKRAEEEDQGA
jgi:hypothetical protein